MFCLTRKSILRWLACLALAQSFLACNKEEVNNFVSNVMRAEVFHQDGIPNKLAIAFVFDNSDSMKPEREFVKGRIAGFMKALDDKRIPYSVGVTTTDYFTDRGRLLQAVGGYRVVTSGDSDPAGKFAGLTDAVKDSNTSFWEMGLKSLRTVMVSDGAELGTQGSYNVGIVLTDENDYTCKPGSYCAGSTPQENPLYIPEPLENFITDFKLMSSVVDETTFAMYPIVGPEEDGCAEAEPGTRYRDVQLGLEKGLTTSICPNDLETSLARVEEAIAGLGSKFPLSAPANLATLQVWVNGVPVPYSETNGFTYKAATYMVEFAEAAIPPKGAVIDVSYVMLTQ